MKYIVFKKILLDLETLYEDARTTDFKLQDALGGGTVVLTTWWTSYIDKTLDSLKMEFDLDEDNDIIDWLFFDCICNNMDLDFEEDGIKYKGTIKNVYLSLVGMLDEKLGNISNLNENSTEKSANLSSKSQSESQSGSQSESQLELQLQLKDYQIKLESVELAKELESRLKNKFFIDNKWIYEVTTYTKVLEEEFQDLMIDSKNMYKRDQIIIRLNNVLNHMSSNNMSLDELNMAKMEVEILLNREKEYNKISSYKVEILEETSSICGSFQWEEETPKNFKITFEESRIKVEWL